MICCALLAASMPEMSDRLGDYLAADERLTAAYSAMLSENTPWVPVSLGVTDRRLLCLTEDGGVVNLGHDAICAVRSRQRTRPTYRGNDYRLLMAAGGLLTVLGVVGVLSLASSLFVALLLPVLVGGLASAEYQRRSTAGVEWPRIAALAKRLRGSGDSSRPPRRNRVVDAAGDRQVLLLANGLIAVLSFAGIAVLASSWLVMTLVFVTVGGLAVMDYAHRHRDDFDGIEIVRRREREVSIRTNDGGTIRIRCDPSDEIDRELSRLAFADRDDPVPTVSHRSTSAAGPGGTER